MTSHALVDDREPWERQPREPARAYSTFRRFRDLGSTRTAQQVVEVTEGEVSLRTVQHWHTDWRWRERARAWDEHVYRVEDDVRLEAIRSMHRNHSTAGRLALAKAIAALRELPDAAITGPVAVRLLDVGARLERSTLTTSVAELQGVEPVDDTEDPWEVIARELQGSPATVRDTETT